MWILIAIISYLLLAVSSLIDKYFLKGPIPDPKLYTFYVGILGASAFLLIPFGVVQVPDASTILVAFIAGAVEIIGFFVPFTALSRFEASRVIPALGGIVPLGTLILTIFLAGRQDILSQGHLIAFSLLVAGTIIVSIERRISVTLQSLFYALCAGFFFSVFFVFSKFVFEAQPFLSGVVWLAVGYVALPLGLLVLRDVRKAVFGSLRNAVAGRGGSGTMFNRHTFLFFGNQTMGGIAGILQNLAVKLVPFGLLPFINALAGIQYFFLFLGGLVIVLKFPQAFKEEVSWLASIQKILSIGLISAGLVLLSLAT